MYCIKHISMFLCTGPVYIHKLTNIHVHVNHIVCNNFQYLEVWCSTKVFLLEKSCWWRKHIGAVLETGKKSKYTWHVIPVISLIVTKDILVSIWHLLSICNKAIILLFIFFCLYTQTVTYQQTQPSEQLFAPPSSRDLPWHPLLALVWWHQYSLKQIHQNIKQILSQTFLIMFTSNHFYSSGQCIQSKSNRIEI